MQFCNFNNANCDPVVAVDRLTRLRLNKLTYLIHPAVDTWLGFQANVIPGNTLHGVRNNNHLLVAKKACVYGLHHHLSEGRM